MAKNDKILIDGIIDDRIDLKLPSDKRDEAFEYFSFEQILKDYDLSNDELKAGSVDGRNDGGIDGFFIFVNGHFLSDPQSFNWPKTGSVLDVWIITCKHHETFRQAPLDNLAASLTELLDFSIDNLNLKGEYADQILIQRENLKFAYRKVSPRLTNFSINFCYASRGNSEDIGSSIESRANQIKQIAIDSFGNCTSRFDFWGSTELIEQNRKSPNFSLELPFVKELSMGERYVLLVNLIDYYNFLKNEEGKLRRYLFDSNVRDFMGLNRVNEDIKSTLLNTDSPDFWWLNNGVTILATHAHIIGSSIQIEDIQIVNGLQSSESIFRHFDSGGLDEKNRSILVKIIVSKNDEVRDSIIRATNNQTTVELASLHATDRIQRDIEDVLKRSGLFYERRTNFYKNQDISRDKILTPLYIAAGFVSLILKSPHRATNLKSRFMRSESSYKSVFTSDVDLNVWPQIGYILKRTDSFLETVRVYGSKNNERFLKTNRQFLSFITISRLIGSYNFNTNQLIEFDLGKYTDDELNLSWQLMKSLPSDNNIKPKAQKNYLISLCKEATSKWQIKNIQRIEKGILFNEIPRKNDLTAKPNEVTMDFAMKVYKLLPPQPWKPGVHREIVKQLNCTNSEYFDSVELLINEGLCNVQKDGVVYDDNGNVICFDEERVDSETLELKKNE